MKFRPKKLLWPELWASEIVVHARTRPGGADCDQTCQNLATKRSALTQRQINLSDVAEIFLFTVMGKISIDKAQIATRERIRQ